MTILVTGSTGTIGSQVVQRLAAQNARIRALVRGDTSRAKIPAGVEPFQGDMTDVASMRTALKGIDTLFLLNAVAADEVTQALGTLDLAREAGIGRIVYFSVFNSALFGRCAAFLREVPRRAGHRRPGHSRYGAAASLFHAERPDVSGCAKGWQLCVPHRRHWGRNG